MADRQTVIRVNHQPSGGKEWVAEITGTHPKFGWAREFLRPIGRNRSSSGKTGSTSFLVLPDKIYQVNEPWKGRYFIMVDENGEIHYLSEEKVIRALAHQEGGE